MGTNFHAFHQKIANPLYFKFFFLMNLPTAFFAGLKIHHLSAQQSAIQVKQKWFNKNPFKSIYFAVLAMAAEVSTGVLCLGHLYQQKPAISMLVVDMKAAFHKKATGKIIFQCNDGASIQAAVEQAIQTKTAQTITCYAEGKNQVGETVAEFWFTWSFKSKS